MNNAYDIRKAQRRGSREGEGEFGNRLRSLPFKDKTKYNRKVKHKKRGFRDGAPLLFAMCESRIT